MELLKAASGPRASRPAGGDSCDIAARDVSDHPIRVETGGGQASQTESPTGGAGRFRSQDYLTDLGKRSASMRIDMGARAGMIDTLCARSRPLSPRA